MTLIETLIAFAIFLVCVTAIVSFIPLFSFPSDPLRQDIHMFFQQVKDDMDHAYEIKRNEDGFTIYCETAAERFTLQYRLSGSNLIRRREGKGHEIVLQHVTGLHAVYTDYGADIEVTDKHHVSWKTVVGFRPALEGRERTWNWGNEEPSYRLP